MERYCAQISLTSISYLSSGDPRLYKLAFDRVERGQENYGSVFSEAAVYAKMMLLHKEFTDRLNPKPTQLQFNISSPEPETITAVQMFNSKKESSVMTLPLSGWTIQALIKCGQDISSMTLERIYTHPLEKNEIDRALKDQSCDPNSTTVQIYLHETLLTPKSEFTFGLENFPKTIIIPATGGIAMSINCPREHTKDGALNFAYTCVPKKYTVGQLTCAVRANDTMLENQDPPRVQRSVGDEKTGKISIVSIIYRVLFVFL